MNPTLSAIRVGVGRGWTEFRQSLTRLEDHLFNVIVARTGR